MILVTPDLFTATGLTLSRLVLKTYPGRCLPNLILAWNRTTKYGDYIQNVTIMFRLPNLKLFVKCIGY